MGKKNKRASQKASDETYCCGEAYDDNRFYMGCSAEGACVGEEWYHGSCVHITAAAAKKIITWYCDKCKEDSSFNEEKKEDHAGQHVSRKVRGGSSSSSADSASSTAVPVR